MKTAGEICNFTGIGEQLLIVQALLDYYHAGRAVCVNQVVTGDMFQAFDLAQQTVDALLGVD